LTTWGERPEDYEIVTVDEDFVVTFEDKFKLSKRYLEEHAEDRPKDSITTISIYFLSTTSSTNISLYCLNSAFSKMNHDASELPGNRPLEISRKRNYF